MGDDEGMGFVEFFSLVDCLIRGRNGMEMISDLPKGVWPYGDTRMIVISTTLNYPPVSLDGKVEMYSGDINDLVKQLEYDGHEHAYIDGGKTIQSFLNLMLINEIILTHVSILLGEGKPLFGKTEQDLTMEESQANVFPNDFVQLNIR